MRFSWPGEDVVGVPAEELRRDRHPSDGGRQCDVEAARMSRLGLVLLDDDLVAGHSPQRGVNLVEHPRGLTPKDQQPVTLEG
jgi:hypothetical protein